MNKTKLSILALILAFGPYTLLQHAKVMDIPLGAFLGEWSYANGFDFPAKIFNRFACDKDEAISCSLAAEIEARAGNMIEASNLTFKACSLGLESACPLSNKSNQ